MVKIKFLFVWIKNKKFDKIKNNINQYYIINKSSITEKQLCYINDNYINKPLYSPNFSKDISIMVSIKENNYPINYANQDSLLSSLVSSLVDSSSLFEVTDNKVIPYSSVTFNEEIQLETNKVIDIIKGIVWNYLIY